MNDNNSEFLRGYVEVIVLKFLKKGGDYIYNIAKKIRERSGGFFTVTNPSLLLTMRKLAEAGCVSYKNELNERGVNRKRYFITEKGCELLEKELPVCRAALSKIDSLLGD